MRSKITSGLGRYEQIEAPILGYDVGCYRSQKGCSIIVAQEPAKRAPSGIWVPPEARMLWHISIAHARRYPTWDEIADARYEFVPDEVTMAMLLPPSDEYVNANEYCFHLWEIEDRRG